MKPTLICACLLFSWAFLAANPQSSEALVSRDGFRTFYPVVTNVSVAQRVDGSGVVDIFFDLADADSDSVLISLTLSSDAGANYSYVIPGEQLSGDFGLGVSPGPAKHIVWNTNEQNYDADNYRILISADDGSYLQCANPVFNPAMGTFPTPIMVSITCTTELADIRYTLDGQDVSPTSSLYTEPLEISSNVVIKAKAFRSGYLPSETVRSEYSIVPPSFVYVAGGVFSNGSSNVTLSSFYINKYEVSQGEFIALMGFNPAGGSGNGDNYPVYNVTWFQCVEYCNRLSLAEGLTPCYRYLTYGTNPDAWPTNWNMVNSYHNNFSCNWEANGYRLPTEMEWMFAARGGNLDDGYIYSGSDFIDEVGWYSENAASTTHPVGTKAPNQLNTYDMTGNVWERCWDIYALYPSTDQINPTGGASGTSRMIRGGGWHTTADRCTTSYRNYTYANSSDNYIGFRLVRSRL